MAKAPYRHRPAYLRAPCLRATWRPLSTPWLSDCPRALRPLPVASCVRQPLASCPQLALIPLACRGICLHAAYASPSSPPIHLFTSHQGCRTGDRCRTSPLFGCGVPCGAACARQQPDIKNQAWKKQKNKRKKKKNKKQKTKTPCNFAKDKFCKKVRLWSQAHLQRHRHHGPQHQGGRHPPAGPQARCRHCNHR